MKATTLPFLILVLLSTQALASVVLYLQQGSKDFLKSQGGLDGKTSPRTTTQQIHPLLNVISLPTTDKEVQHPNTQTRLSLHDFTGSYLEFSATIKSNNKQGPGEEFLLKADVPEDSTWKLSEYEKYSTWKIVSDGTVDSHQRGSRTLNTTPFLNDLGIEIGRTWSGCIPNHGPFTIRDVLYLERTKLNVEGSLNRKTFFHEITALPTPDVHPQSFKFTNPSKNRKYYSLVTSETDVSISARFLEDQNATFVPTECGCPENPSCSFTVTGNNFLSLNASTTYQIFYQGPSDGEIEIGRDMRTKNFKNMAARYTSSLSMLIVVVGYFLWY